MKYEIPLSEAGIQAIINGREVNKKLPDGTELVIRQSYLKDMAAPVLIDRFNRIRQKSPILYRWVMNAVRYEGYRW
ncbi:hypothetical protein [Enterococcus faecium]|uniref:hypothetical protein n=1 Tax=Enterococcus faecium TaxID=1352 RepID=UPI0022B43D1C|nr:hypothetical protein [Enterococcus faecium]WBA00358.1 hypothetical protein O4N81_04320 [Enterococcus faecium]